MNPGISRGIQQSVASVLTNSPEDQRQMPKLSITNVVVVAVALAIAVFLALNVDNLSKETGKVTVTSVEAPSGGANAVSQTREFEIVSVLAFDTIRSIDKPQILDTESASEVYQPTEMVLGIEINGDARAYSVPTLSRHEIVNDVVGGESVAITW